MSVSFKKPMQDCVDFHSLSFLKLCCRTRHESNMSKKQIVVTAWLISLTGTWLSPLREITCFTQIYWPCLCLRSCWQYNSLWGAISSILPASSEEGSGAGCISAPQAFASPSPAGTQVIFGLRADHITTTRRPLRQEITQHATRQLSHSWPSAGLAECWLVILLQMQTVIRERKAQQNMRAIFFFNSGWPLLHWNLFTESSSALCDTYVTSASLGTQ